MIDFIFPVFVVDEENAAIQKRCFDTFKEFTPKPYRVIVIDNGSLYGMEDAREIADEYVRFHNPIGFAKAVNEGWRLSKNQFIGVLNNDLTFTPSWFEPLLERLVSGDADIVAPATQKFAGLSTEIWSSAFILPQTVREKIGFFDEEHLPYRYHDQDYWIRAKKLGFRFRRVGDSLVHHKESTTYNKMPNKDSYSAREAEIMRQRYGVEMAEHYNV